MATKVFFALGGLSLLALTHTAAAQTCKALALLDVVAIEDPSAILKHGTILDDVTEYRVLEKRSAGVPDPQASRIGVGEFCAHGDYCYPAEIVKDGRTVEALKLINCRIGKFDPVPEVLKAIRGVDDYRSYEVNPIDAKASGESAHSTVQLPSSNQLELVILDVGGGPVYPYIPVCRDVMTAQTVLQQEGSWFSYQVGNAVTGGAMSRAEPPPVRAESLAAAFGCTLVPKGTVGVIDLATVPAGIDAKWAATLTVWLPDGRTVQGVAPSYITTYCEDVKTVFPRVNLSPAEKAELIKRLICTPKSQSPLNKELRTLEQGHAGGQ